MTLTELQQQIDTWIKQYGVRYFNELTNTTLLMEEVGEFARLAARVFGEQSFKPGSEPMDTKEALADELADIMFVLVCLSNQLQIDLEHAMMKNLQKKIHRDKDRHLENPKLQ